MDGSVSVLLADRVVLITSYSSPEATVPKNYHFSETQSTGRKLNGLIFLEKSPPADKDVS